MAEPKNNIDWAHMINNLIKKNFNLQNKIIELEKALEGHARDFLNTVCPHCKGHGEVLHAPSKNNKEVCLPCAGKGIIPLKNLEIEDK